MHTTAAEALEAVRTLIGVEETRFGVVREGSARDGGVIHGHDACRGALLHAEKRPAKMFVTDVVSIEEVLATSCRECAVACAESSWLTAALRPVIATWRASLADASDAARDGLWGEALRACVMNPRGNITLHALRTLLAAIPLREGSGRLVAVNRLSVRDCDVGVLANGAWHGVAVPTSLVWAGEWSLPRDAEVLSEHATMQQVGDFARLWECYESMYEWRDVREVWELSRAVNGSV